MLNQDYNQSYNQYDCTGNYPQCGFPYAMPSTSSGVGDAVRPFKEPTSNTQDISFMTVSDDDSVYNVVSAPPCDSAVLPSSVENMAGQRTIEIPVFDTMTKFMMSRQGANQRLTLYTYLNNILRRGQLSRIVGDHILNRNINAQICKFTKYQYWEMSRNEFIADISVELQLRTRNGEITWKGVLECWCGFADKFYMTVEDLHESVDRAKDGYTPLDQFLIQVYKGYEIDREMELMWTKCHMKEALKNPKARNARKLAEALGLTVIRRPIYEHKGINSILFFEGGTLIVGEDRVEQDENGNKFIVKDDHGVPEYIPANTIVINSNRIDEEYENFPIFHECYHYEKHYLAFRLQKLTCSDSRKIKKQKITIEKNTKYKDHLFLMENQADRGAYALWMPAKDTDDRIRIQLGKVTVYHHKGELFESAGKAVASQLNIPHFRMRARMIQLGYIEAKGILHYVERKKIRPFAFDPDSMKVEDITFFITPAKCDGLGKESEEFKRLVDSKRYVYAEGHMVFNNPMFVSQQGAEYKLTDFGIANVDVCCLRFIRVFVQKNLGEYVLGRMYMDAEYVERTLFYLRDQFKHTENLTEFAAKRAYKNAFPLDFKECVELLKKQSRTKKGEATNEQIAEYMHMADSTFQEMLSNPAKTSNPDFVLALCLFFKLPDWIALLLFKRAGAVLDEDKPRHGAFLHIIRAMICDGIDAANEYLDSQGEPPLSW